MYIVYSTATHAVFLPPKTCFFRLTFLRLGPSAAGKSTLLPQMQVGFISGSSWPYMNELV